MSPLRPGPDHVSVDPEDTLQVDEGRLQVDARRTETVPVSTKITVAHARVPVDFHLYQERGDEENLHLEVNSGGSTTILTIPMGLAFGAARKISALEKINMRIARETDAEIAETINSEVDARIENAHDPLTHLVGLLIYGSVHDPREDQVKSGIKEMTRTRDRCIKMLQLADDMEMGRV